jgi:hypothetical protein
MPVVLSLPRSAVLEPLAPEPSLHPCGRLVVVKFKEWLTVPDAARHLSILFGEDVSEADVLQLALDGHLTLSVHFVNHAESVGSRDRASTYS